MLRNASRTLIGFLAILGSARGAPPSQAIAPFVDGETTAVIRFDLAKLDVAKSARRLLGPIADKGPTTRPLRDLAAWTESLRKAGAAEVYVLLKVRQGPSVVVPLVAGADRPKLVQTLAGKARLTPNPFWQVGAVADTAVFAGRQEELERVRRADAKTPLPPWIAVAMKAEEAADIQVVFAPNDSIRQDVEQQMPTLPPAFGGKPVTVLTRGLTWGSLGVRLEPKASIHVTARATDAKAAQALDKLAADALKFLAPVAPNILMAFGPGAPPVPGMTKLVEQIEVKVEGDRLTAGLDIDPVADLVRQPLAQIRPMNIHVDCVNNLKQIMLAMHNYHSANNAFPPAFKASKTGKPLLSWRVLILPYLDQNDLYKEFHLDEPWSSPHNKALIAKMPDVYRCPSLDPEKIPIGKTSYLTPRGKRSIFPGATGVGIAQITDGTSNTVAVVDAGADNMVVWTVPDDWEVDGGELKPETILKQHIRGSYVGFADGSVRLLQSTINRIVFGALLTRDGGEVISADQF
jgi:hypothetical protein